jgi:hypothetical protein
LGRSLPTLGELASSKTLELLQIVRVDFTRSGVNPSAHHHVKAELLVFPVIPEQVLQESWSFRFSATNMKRQEPQHFLLAQEFGT